MYHKRRLYPTGLGWETTESCIDKLALGSSISSVFSFLASFDWVEVPCTRAFAVYDPSCGPVIKAKYRSRGRHKRQEEGKEGWRHPRERVPATIWGRGLRDKCKANDGLFFEIALCSGRSVLISLCVPIGLECQKLRDSFFCFLVFVESREAARGWPSCIAKTGHW